MYTGNKISNICKYKVLFLLLIVLLTSCYSFRGGTIPPHLKTIYIATVRDNSGFGNPRHKEVLNQVVVDKFRRDNSLSVEDRNGDARLTLTIRSINEASMAVSGGAAELERERKITVSCDVEYYDTINKQEIWKKSFSNTQVYDVRNMQTARDEAIAAALEILADDILLAVVSGW